MTTSSSAKEPPISQSNVISHDTPASRSAWDAELISLGGHFLQSSGWGELKYRHGWRCEQIRVSVSGSVAMAQVLYRHKGPISIGYIPRGPVISGDAERVWDRLIAEIDRAGRAHRAIMTIIEPNADLGLTGRFQDARVKPGPEHIQPGRTVKVHLDANDVMLQRMHQKTRYSVRLAGRRGVEVRRALAGDTSSLDQFYSLMQDTADRNEFSVHSREYYQDFMDIFGDDAFFVFAESEGHIACTVMALAFGKEAAYMYGASSTEHRGHGASFLLQFEAMKWAREHGCEWYDLWGIPMQDPDTLTAEDKTSLAGTKGDDWRGIYRFKTGFGGEIVLLPHTMERQHVPGLPWLARRLGAVQG